MLLAFELWIIAFSTLTIGVPIVGVLSLDLNPALGASFYYFAHSFAGLALIQGVVTPLASLTTLITYFVYVGPHRIRALFLLFITQWVLQVFILILTLFYWARGFGEINLATLILEVLFIGIGVGVVAKKKLQLFGLTHVRVWKAALVQVSVVGILFSFLLIDRIEDPDGRASLVMEDGYCVDIDGVSFYVPRGCLLWPKSETAFDAICGNQIEQKQWFDVMSVVVEDSLDTTVTTEPQCESMELPGPRHEATCSLIIDVMRVKTRFLSPSPPEDPHDPKRAVSWLLDENWCKHKKPLTVSNEISKTE